MRLFILLISTAVIACGTSKKTTMHQSPFNGSWSPIQQEFAGTPLPKPAFEKQKLIISDSNYTLIAESVDKGVITTNGNKMDIYGREGVNKGKHFMALFKMENNQLVVCYNLKGDGYPEVFDTKGKPMWFLSVFVKDAPPK